MPTSGGSQRRWWAAHPFWTVFALALTIRLINVALLKGDDAFFAESDARDYWGLAADLMKPGAFWSTLRSMTYRMPLYPLLLAGIRTMWGDVPRLVAIVQALIDAGTCTMIAALGMLVSPRVGLIAGIIAALSSALIVLSSQILTDSLFLFFLTLMLLAAAQFLVTPTNALALIGGVAGGLSLVTRPAVALLLLTSFPLVFGVAFVRRRRLIPAITAAALFAIGAMGPIAPVWLRNVVDYGSFALTSQTGDHLAYWIVPTVTQRTDGTSYQVSVDRIRALFEKRLSERGLADETNPFRRDAVKIEVAREEMARRSMGAFVNAWLDGMVVNLAAPALLEDPRVRALPKPSFYGTPGTTLWERARVYFLDDPGAYQLALLVGCIVMAPFLILQAVGFVLLARIHPWVAIFAGGILAYFLLLNGPVVSPKYRLPMEPVLIVLTAIPLAWVMERWRGGAAARSEGSGDSPKAPLKSCRLSSRSSDEAMKRDRRK